MAKSLYLFGLIILLVLTELVQSLQNCTCHDYNGERYGLLDCSYLQRSALLISDYMLCGYVKNWNFRGNYLQTFQYQRNFGEGSSLDISENQLGFGSTEDLFNDLFRVKNLDISNNFIKSINFTNTLYTRLNSLNASRNGISNLNDLRKCPLYYLRVDYNDIKSLPNNTFAPNSQSGFALRYIDLSHNPIASVEAGSFGVNSRLQTLFLRNTYVLQSLPENVFSGLQGLKTLSLAGNKLENLPKGIFKNLNNLEDLQLQSNVLVNLPWGIFDNLVRLRSLILSDNKIEQISPDIFSRLHSLESLALMKNRLKSLPSLHLCSGPLQTAIFNMNEITNAPEPAVRALMRYGFLFGDLRQNPFLPAEVFKWAENATDIQIDWNDRPCGRLSFTAGNHGSVIFCYNSTESYNTFQLKSQLFKG